MRSTVHWLGLGLTTLLLGCPGGDDGSAVPTDSGIVPPQTSTDTTTGGGPGLTGPADSTDSSAGSSDDAVGDPCLFCNAPNQQCIDDVCVTTCQGQQPDPCGPAQVCDVVSGECRDPDDPCTLFGAYEPCDGALCGPGTVCDGQGTCLPVAPCGDVACLDDGSCWGSACACERAMDCTPPSEADLNGDFAVEISDLEFADDCTAWMVTLRSGTDYLRRLTPDGTLTEWPGVSNLNMGEVKVLKAVTPPAGLTTERPSELSSGPAGEPSRAPGLRGPAAAGVEGLGEVALTYTCCSTCGCFTDPPQGVARLVEDDPANPLPLVIESTITQGTGPFGTSSADAGPFGLTWGIDRVLYVGNSTLNGELVTADLEMGSQAALGSLGGRITASTPVSAAHLLLAIEGGEVLVFNVRTASAQPLVDLMEDVTSLSHDAFDGTVYVGLRNLEVLELRWTTGATAPFAVMPGIGRVTVSPNGELWFSPVGFIEPNAISAWDLPDAW